MEYSDNTEKNCQPDETRRKFLKIGVAGAGIAAAAATGVTIGKRMKGIPHDEFPLSVSEDYKPIRGEDIILHYSHSKALNAKHPERTKAFNGFNFYEKNKKFMKQEYRNTPGYSQLERALQISGFSAMLALVPGGVDATNSGVLSWEQTMLAPNKFVFKSPEDAALRIKSAAKLFGAVRCGITPRDKRWDLQPIYDFTNERELDWDKDFPFIPKSVIVILVEMDYKAIATAPSWACDGSVGNGYAQVTKIAGQLAVFMRQLGFKAVASTNDLGMNVPYAVAAGLGEGGRNGAIITPHYGPRVRISKVYTDFDLAAYDKPRTYGVASFCKHCKRCADSCPSQAITHGDPTWGPTYSTDPANIWHASPGILKFHNDAKKCFQFWCENDGGCANCIAACPYNKPDFWHHRLVDAQNVISPGPVHSFMREMDILFGYGKVSDPDALKNFWETGEKS